MESILQVYTPFIVVVRFSSWVSFWEREMGTSAGTPCFRSSGGASPPPLRGVCAQRHHCMAEGIRSWSRSGSDKITSWQKRGETETGISCVMASPYGCRGRDYGCSGVCALPRGVSPGYFLFPAARKHAARRARSADTWNWELSDARVGIGERSSAAAVTAVAFPAGARRRSS